MATIDLVWAGGATEATARLAGTGGNVPADVVVAESTDEPVAISASAPDDVSAGMVVTAVAEGAAPSVGAAGRATESIAQCGRCAAMVFVFSGGLDTSSQRT